MHYQSTRGSAPILGFEEVLLTGLARDGGLYLPSQWPGLSSTTWRSLVGADGFQSQLPRVPGAD